MAYTYYSPSIYDIVIRALFYIANKNNKRYTVCSQWKILEIMKRYYGVKISRTWLNVILKRLEKEGFIERIRRHKKGPRGQILFHTTLIKLKKRLYRCLASIAWFFRRAGWTSVKKIVKTVVAPEYPIPSRASPLK